MYSLMQTALQNGLFDLGLKQVGSIKSIKDEFRTRVVDLGLASHVE